MKRKIVLLVLSFLLVFTPFNTLFTNFDGEVVSAATTVLKRGDNKPAVKQLKLDLARIGFVVSNNPNNSFGPSTERKVKEFQTYYGLTPDGIAGPATQGMINSILNSPLQRGKKSTEAISLKNYLMALGYGNFAGNTSFGPSTERALKNFQRDHGLVVNGIGDPVTLNKLKELAFPMEFKQGDRHPSIIQLKRNLAKAGFVVEEKPSNYFHYRTKVTVMNFQSYYGLEANGIVGKSTFDMIDSIINSPLQRGKKSNEAIELKAALMKLGYGNFVGNTSFGPSTEKALKNFQHDNGLAVNGIGDPVTLKKLYELANISEFKQGDRHPAIIQLKRNLAKAGFVVEEKPSNYFHYRTKVTVMEFQSYYGLTADGIVGPATFDMIDLIINSPLQRGKQSMEVVKIKDWLKILGYGNLGTSQSFDSNTEKALKNFQRDQGLVVNGIGDPVTVKRLESLANPSEFKQGDRHPDIVQIKKNLAKTGFVVEEKPSNYFHYRTKVTVMEFQSYYGLTVDGIVGPATFKMIDSIVNSPLQRGEQSKEAIRLKEALMALGYGSFVGNENFGPSTERALKQFQKDHNLVVNGIGDPVTLNKLYSLYEEWKNSREKITYMYVDRTFEEALNIQMTLGSRGSTPPQTDKYRNSPAYIHGDYVTISHQATIYSSGNVNIRTSPRTSDNRNIAHTVPNGTKIVVLEEVEGDVFSGSTKWYRIEYKGNSELYVHSRLVNLNTQIATVTTSSLRVRSEPNTSSHIYGSLSRGKTATVVEKVGDWYQIKYQVWRNATRSDTAHYLNPNNNDRFQHLLLSSSVGLPSDEINKVLNNQGILHNKGAAFIEGGQKYKVNEIYLIAHAFLETGRGTSELANGVEVGLNKSGNPVLVTNNNRKELTDIRMTYNMFGIGAVDSNPLAGGAIRAYEEEWFTPEAAIIGGAKFVGERYIHHKDYKQDTLYKMRWNPSNPGTHQYATDVAWATKQISMIKNIYDQLNNPVLHFDIPVYKK